MKKMYLFILIPICLVAIFLLSYEKTDIKIYEKLDEIDSAIDMVINEPNQPMANVLSFLQNTFEDLVEIGITFTESQDITENFEQFTLALNHSTLLEQKLTDLLKIESIKDLSELNQLSLKGTLPLKGLVEQKEVCIEQLNNILNLLTQINSQIVEMNNIFYSKRNTEVFQYISVIRESFNQTQDSYNEYSQSVTEYMKLKANIYSQIK